MEKVGRFQVLRRILAGERDVLYLVAEPRADRKYVLKMVQLDGFAKPARIPQLRQDLWREVKSARSLTHPAIVVPEDIFEQLGVCWIVMASIPGQDLGAFFAQRQPLAKETIRSILREVAAALDYAHRNGMIHGRMKPSKIMLPDDGSVRVLGFGLTKVSASGVKNSGLTAGSPDYAAPEFLRGDGLLAQSDQFSLAGIAYHLLAGSKPFPGTPDEVRQDVAERSPALPETLNPTLDPAIGRVLSRALSKSPEARFRTCAEFVGALEKELDAAPGWEVPVPAERERVPLAPRRETPVSESLVADAPVETAKTAEAPESKLILPPLVHEEKPPEPEARAAFRKPVLAAAAVLVLLAGAVFYLNRGPDAAGVTADSANLAPARPELRISTPDLPAGTVGQSYSAILSAAGEQTPLRWSLGTTSLPAGLALDEAAGTIQGTPSEAGDFPLSASVTSASQQTATAEFTLRVGSDLAITTPPELPSAVVDRAYSAGITAAAAAAPAEWSLAAGSLPPGIALDAAKGVLSGRPREAGAFPFTLRVRDASRASAEQPFTLRVGSGLTITSAGRLPSGIARGKYSTRLAAAAGKAPLRWSVESGTLPPGVSLDGASGAIQGSPIGPGSYEFTAKVVDASEATASQAFRIDIRSDLTIARATLPRTSAGTRFTHTLSATGGLPPARWSVSGGSLPPGVSLSPATGVIEGAASAAGRFGFEVTVTDASGTSATAKLSLDVAPALAITGGSAPETAVVGAQYVHRLQASGGAPPYQWSIADGSLPPGLQLDAAGAVIRGVPSAAGTYTLRVRLSDASQARLEAPLTLIVGAPLVISAALLPPGELANEYFAPLAATGGQPPYRWALAEGSLPSGLSLSETNGQLSGRPSEAGEFSFSARLTDATGTIARRAFRLRVSGSPLQMSNAPRLPDATTGESYSHTLTATGGQPPYQWSLAKGRLPRGLTLDAKTGAVHGEPAEEGRFPLQLQLREALGATALRSVELVVGAAQSGRMVWQGQLEGNRVLTIQDGRYPSIGSLTGALPGQPVRIEIESEGVSVVTAPGEDNAWKLLVIHSGDQARSELVIKWSRTSTAP